MFVQNLFLVSFVALLGGLIMKYLRLPILIGYILAGIGFSMIFPVKVADIENLAQLGILLLLFSIGTELSLKRLTRIGNVVIIASVIQIIIVSFIFSFFFRVFGVSFPAALILAAGFSLSSTALVVKLLVDRGESGSIQGEILTMWLLTQDLMVIPIIILLPSLTSGEFWISSTVKALLLSLLLISSTLFLGKLAVPYVIHRIASYNSRELLFLAAISLAVGVAALTSVFGVSPALGAFLAGLVISDTQENHAIFAETRPLRDLFVTLFFVSLGFLINPTVFVSHLGLILVLTISVIIVKFFVVYLISLSLGIRGKTSLYLSIGLSQVGEFAFILFLLARNFRIIDPVLTSVGISTTLLTLILTPLTFRTIIPIWRKIKLAVVDKPDLKKILLSQGDLYHEEDQNTFKDHIIICGFGRVGGWIGKAFDSAGIRYIVIDYNQRVVSEVQKQGIPVIYGDPAEPEVLEAADVRLAKGVIIAVPDRITQEEIISYVQTVNPKAKIISRAHLDEDWERLSSLKVDRVVQPEFEASISIIKSIFINMGKSKEEIALRIKNLKYAHSVKK